MKFYVSGNGIFLKSHARERAITDLSDTPRAVRQLVGGTDACERKRVVVLLRNQKRFLPLLGNTPIGETYVSPIAWFRQRSIFPGSHPPSIVDAKELNFRVRYGNGWSLLAITTGSEGNTLKTKQCKNFHPENSCLVNLTLVKPSTY